MSRGLHVRGAAQRQGFGHARIWSISRRRFSGRILLFVLGFVLAAGAGAFGYFTTTGTGSAQSQATTLGTPGLSAAVSTSTVTLTVTAPGSGPTPLGYSLGWTSGGNGTGGTCTSTPSTGTCTFTGVASGPYTYTLNATYDSWVSASATAMATFSTGPPPPPPPLVVNNGSYSPQSDLPSVCLAPNPVYTTIQAAVNAATSDATIYVCAGTYDESNVAISIDEPLTIEGAQFGVNAVGRSGQPETVIDDTAGIVYGAGATTGTLSGFTLNGYTGSVGEIDAANVGSAWTFTDNIIDVSNGGIYFNTDDAPSPGATTISDNEFTQSTSSEAGSGDFGQAVLIWQKAADNVSINNNDFSDLSGPGANINTTGAGTAGTCPESSTGLSISDNTSEVNGAAYDDNFVALFCTTGASIATNTFTVTDSADANAVPPIYLGGGDSSPVVTGNTLNGDGATYASGIAVSTAFYPTDNATVEDNSITDFGDNGTDGQGIVVYGFGHGEPTGFTIEGNTLTGNGDGILIYNDGSGYPSGAITGNDVTGSVTDDCVDQTTGGGTLGTDNMWTANTGANSSPAGLCTGQGNWVGIYGSTGYTIGAWKGSSCSTPCAPTPDDDTLDLASLPSGVTYSTSAGILRYQWASPTTDPRALESPDTTFRQASCWYSNTTFTITLTFTSAFSGNLELYAVDWDSRGRNETITVTDSNGSTPHTLSSFVNGAWVTQAINVSSGGMVTITVVHNAGDNAVLSGLFLN